MFERLCIPDAYFWSHPLERALAANGYFFVTAAGNVVVDPPPVDESAHREIERLGGLSRVIVMTAERRSTALALAARYAAAVVETPQHREPLFPGALAIGLPDQRRGDEFAIGLAQHRTVIVGDAILGSPAGALSMPPDDEYADACKAALGLRAILRQDPQTLLLACGQSLFGGAYAALYRLLYARAGAEVHRINVDQLDFRNERREHEVQPARYHCSDAEVGFEIGARTLGYRVSTLEPGQRFCPLHGHVREEELFFVLEGSPSVRTLSGTIRCRKGDFIAFPAGATGTHQLLNESEAPATVLLLARSEDVEACYYPDSDKLLLDAAVPIVDDRTSLLVRASPQLDYFEGEA